MNKPENITSKDEKERNIAHIITQIHELPREKRTALWIFLTHMDVVEEIIAKSFSTRKQWEDNLAFARERKDDFLLLLLKYQDLRGHVTTESEKPGETDPVSPPSP